LARSPMAPSESRKGAASPFAGERRPAPSNPPLTYPPETPPPPPHQPSEERQQGLPRRASLRIPASSEDTPSIADLVAAGLESGLLWILKTSPGGVGDGAPKP